MTPEEELREERIALVVEGCKVSEDEAINIIDQNQGELFERGKG